MKYIKHKNIDPEKWDTLLKKVPFTPFYFLYSYLTTICKWDAIIEEVDSEYNLVIPLPFKQKLWIKYLYQPFFCQQLGIISTSDQWKSRINEIEKIIKIEFSFGQVKWNTFNTDNEYFKTKNKTNYILDLIPSFEEAQQKFNNNRKRILKRLANERYEINETENTASNIDATIDRFSKIFQTAIPEIGPSHYQVLKEGLHSISSACKIHVFEVKENDQVLASSLFVSFQGRIIYLLGFTENTYRKTAVHSLLFERLISKMSNSKKILDFEGGESSGIAQFYSSFGAQKEIYSEVSFMPNHLIFKKIFR